MYWYAAITDPFGQVLILPAGLEAECVLAVHRADRVPIKADMPGDGVDVAPRTLHRVAKHQAIPARRGIERLHRLESELGCISLVAAAADAVGDRDLLAGAQFLHRIAQIGHKDHLR